MLSNHSRAGSALLASWTAAAFYFAGCTELLPIGSGTGTADATSEDGGGLQGADGGSVGDGSVAPCQCTGYPPLVPTEECEDGSMGGPVCAQHADGTCAWEVRSCPRPDDCPAYGCNPMCPNGVRKDARGCDTCQCADAPNPCAGLSCGDPCNGCVSGALCPAVVHFCDAKEACVPRIPTCGDEPPELRWYPTCGSPVCNDEPPDPSLPSCGSIKEGDVCTEKDAVCDPGVGCGVKLRCDDEPLDTDACPISSRKHKTGIDYLTAPDLEGLARTLQSIKLATYHYKQQAPAEQKHLGFIIEDAPGSPAVFMNRERVDLYGYASMAVAALQVQDRKIQALERELSALRSRLESTGAADMCSTPAP